MNCSLKIIVLGFQQILTDIPSRAQERRLGKGIHDLNQQGHWSLIRHLNALIVTQEHTKAKEAFLQDWERDTKLQNRLGASWKSYEQLLREEISTLASQQHIFCKYSLEAFEDIFDLQSQDLIKQLEKVAPQLIALLRVICAPLLSQDPTDATINPQVDGRIVLIVSIICFTQQPRNCDYLPTMLGLFFHEQGAKKSLFHLANQMGIVSSYWTVMETIKGLKEKAQQDIEQLGKQGPFFAVAYDNCELTIGVQEQSLNHQQKLHSITTGCIVPGRDFPPEGLWQSMINPRIKLKIEDIIFADGNREDDPLNTQVLRGFGYQALAKYFPGIEAIYSESDIKPFEVPPCQRIKPVQKFTTPIMPIQISEATNDAHITIQDNIFQGQFKLKEAHFIGKPLYLEIGDQKTVSRIRPIKLSAEDNLETYNKLLHVLPIPGLFHLLLNMCALILNTYYMASEEGPTFPCYLRWTQGKLDRRHVSPNGKLIYSHAETFLIDNWDARFVAELFDELKIPPLASEKQVQRRLLGLQPQQLNTSIEQAVRRIKQPPYQCDDLERRMHLLFLQDCEIFLILRHAVRWGDVGLIKRAVDRAILLFHGGQTMNYAKELLYFKRLIDTEYCKPELRTAILSTCLVNKTGRPNAFYAVDEDVEFLNKDIKESWKIRHTSTLTIKDLSERATLNGIYFRRMGFKLQQLFGKLQSGKRTQRKRSEDHVLLVKELRNSLIYSEGRSPQGLIQLEDRLAKAIQKLTSVSC